MSTARTERKTAKNKNGKAGRLHMPKWNSLDISIGFREAGIAGNQPPEGALERYAKMIATGTTNELKMILQEEGIVTEEQVEKYLKNCTALLPFDEHGFFIRENQFIGMLSMSATRTGWTTKRLGLKQTLIQGTTRVKPAKVYLKGGKLSVPARGMSLPRGGGVIKRSQVLAGFEPIEFTLTWIDNGDIRPVEMKELISLAQEVGIGGDRRFGYGRFDILEMTNNGKCSLG